MVNDPVGFPGGTGGKEPSCQCRRHKRHEFDPRVRKIPWRTARELTPVFLPEESPGQRSLAGYSPWGHTGSDTTEVTSHACMYERPCIRAFTLPSQAFLPRTCLAPRKRCFLSTSRPLGIWTSWFYKGRAL